MIKGTTFFMWKVKNKDQKLRNLVKLKFDRVNGAVKAERINKTLEL